MSEGTPRRATVAQVAERLGETEKLIAVHVAEDRAWRAAQAERETRRDATLAEILDQARRTNGRVTSLEAKGIEEAGAAAERRRLWRIVAGAVGLAVALQTVVLGVLGTIN